MFRELLASGEIAAGSIIGFKNDDNYPLPAREGNKDGSCIPRSDGLCTDFFFFFLDEESAERHGKA